MVDETAPDEPASTPKPTPDGMELRLFLIEVKNSEGRVLGYAVAERVGWHAVDSDPRLYPLTAPLTAGLETMVEGGARAGQVMRALSVPAARDPAGKGYLMSLMGESLLGRFLDEDD